MTFKHVKFEDSPTMRALEKVAREKGLVKPEPLTKKASLTKKADLTPTTNLMENIFKLCHGLREQGMVKEAVELETNYLQFKQAQTLYETSKETGEDVVEQAHPDGSHKLEDVDSTEAVVEDILDKHEKIEEVAEKNPKGKLSDAQSVIARVKTVLGQITAPKESEADLINSLRTQLGKIIPLLSTAVRFMNEDGGDYDKETAEEAAKDMRDAIGQWPFKIENFHSLQAALQKLQSVSNSGKFKGNTWVGNMLGLEQDSDAVDAWNRRVGPQMTQLGMVISSVGAIVGKLENVEILRQQGKYTDPGSAAGGGAGSLYATYKAQLGSLKTRYELYQGRRDYDRVPKANQQRLIDFLGSIKTDIDNMTAFIEAHKADEASLKDNKGDIDSRIANLSQRLNTYKAKVIDAQPQGNPTGAK